jgi:uncharacterized membrane protein YphA (DoxX/SURF4 family)
MKEPAKESKFSNWIFNSYYPTKEGLGLYRIFSALFILFFLLPPVEMYQFLGSLPSDFYAPPPGPMLLFDGFPPEIVFYVLHSILIIALLCLLLGFKTTAASITTGMVLLVIKGLFYSVGKINHDLLVVALPIVMAFSNWGAVYSIDSLRNKSKQESEVYGWPLVLLALMIGFMMFTAGFPKILGGWLYWDTQATFGHFFKQYFLNGRQDLLANYALQIENRFAWELLDYGTIIFETGFLLAILTPRTTRLFVCFAVIFHFSIMMMLNIAFLPNFLAYAAFLDWSLIHRKIQQRFSGQYNPLMVIGAFFIVISAIILVGYQYNIPELHSDLTIQEFYLLLTALLIALAYIIHQAYTIIRAR